ncbi:MAG: X-Pro aminopeptidase [Hyphomicrobiales bacterium]|nr:MAG: X-Pro aminopeptidase [Hyphomicrobiales bacterium]
MYQSFDETNDPSVGSERVARLRDALAARGLDGFLVPRADEHQGEYVPASAERLRYLTGFSGSAGMAVVLGDEAAVFVDGRYTLQVREQVDVSVFTPQHLIETPPRAWLADRLKPGMRLGYDPMLHTIAEVRRLDAACNKAGATLVAAPDNPLDAIWNDQPAPPMGAVVVHPVEFAGEEASAKIARVGEAIAKAGADATVLTQPDSIAWLFNIRGSDVPHTPLPLSFAIVPCGEKPTLFIASGKLSDEVRAHLEALADVAEPDALFPALNALGTGKTKVLLDADWTAAAIAQRIEDAGGTVVEGRDPVTLPKAIKNETEQEGSRAAHRRDAVAMVQFLAWLDDEAPKGGLDEISAAEKLESFRAATGLLKDLSFDTISAAGPHAAIPHYRVSRSSALPLKTGEIYLVDSGGQYQDGTTDITRTVIVGEASAEMKRHFTLVLKGHIAIDRARFPKGASGAQLDVLARLPLWQAGCDFDHGTGHGVGSYLSVHEGPQRISKLGTTPLEPGMILSNEPGYYQSGAFGIRIENLVVVTAPSAIKGGDREMLGFEALTLVPIDKRLIDVVLLDVTETAWLDAYHARVWDEIGPMVDDEARVWLRAATAPLG